MPKRPNAGAPAGPPRRARRRATATSDFGVGKRESHDASAFYARFEPPVVADDATVSVNPPGVLDRVYHADARSMTELADNSVALVVTSPPYFVGKEYEDSIKGAGQIPESYVEFLQMLEDVFAECVRKLEPGGRIAVNVANLGRKPYRSLSSDVIRILQDRLRLLLRGEVVWVKARAAGGSCAWGTFRQPANPVLRDLTERVIIASKGRFDRAVKPGERRGRELPHEASVFADEFLEATTDLWEIPPESAVRVGHPAPFPVELPQRLIELYTYRGDVVLDPFMGSGSAAVAARRTGRFFVGYDTDEKYVRAAMERVAAEGGQASASTLDGRGVKELADEFLGTLFASLSRAHRVRGAGVVFDFAAAADGASWLFDSVGGFTASRSGLRRTDTLWRAVGKASVVQHALGADRPRVVLLATDLPERATPNRKALDAVCAFGDAARFERDRLPLFDVVDLHSPPDMARLTAAVRR